jgi:hypothetical protein
MKIGNSNWLAQDALGLFVLPGMPVVGHRFTSRALEPTVPKSVYQHDGVCRWRKK